MSITPQDLFDSGKAYIASEKEVDKRNGLSRIYYGAYHLLSRVFPLPDGYRLNPPKGMHKTYIHFLENQPVGSLERPLGLKLKKLYGRRVYADYGLNQELIKSDPALQISNAEEIFSSISNLINSSETQDSSS